jgi:hypothetical protein
MQRERDAIILQLKLSMAASSPRAWADCAPALGGAELAPGPRAWALKAR